MPEATTLKKKLDEGQDDLTTIAWAVNRPHSAGRFRLSLASKVVVFNAVPNCSILARVQPH
ncbi:MAG: hypothetical protein ACJ77R_00810, partial [Gemmatimonadaceae bacterium]